jgi:hypothetical protein
MSIYSNKENVPNQLFNDIFIGFIGNKINSQIDLCNQDDTLEVKSLGGIELENYNEGEYDGLEEYENN